jgi:hypothetical protein
MSATIEDFAAKRGYVTFFNASEGTKTVKHSVLQVSLLFICLFYSLNNRTGLAVCYTITSSYSLCCFNNGNNKQHVLAVLE